ncbi:hypothetical protein [Cerasicoccus frondis]|uniref:hypothetical protein n=1 Tax=Cerasicoccus frondis TaxID=490090 RepID=UPI0028528476|nr:hypothetical protein [Cerasicoccus frondis]
MKLHVSGLLHSARNLAIIASCLLAISSLTADSIYSVTGTEVTQEIALNAGWNAVYLEVDPEGAAPAEVFANADIEAVWFGKSSSTDAEFISSPNEASFSSDGWYFYLADPDTTALSTLSSIYGGRCYLIKATVDTTISISGEPIYRRTPWESQTYKLTGFHVDPATAITFQDFLNLDADAAADLLVYQMDADGDWNLVAAPQNELVQSGVAYWVYNDGTIYDTGPWTLYSLGLDGIDFGASSGTSSLSVMNNSRYDLTDLTLSMGADMPLTYYVGLNAATADSVWEDVAGYTEDIGVDEQQTIILGIVRSAGEAGSEDILTISGGGMRVHVRVSTDDALTDTGLWYGSVILDAVSYVNDVAPTAVPIATESEFTFNVILHVSADGAVRLLKEAYLVGETNDNSDVQPVLVANDELLADYDGLWYRDGSSYGARFSAMTYGFDEDALMLTGSLETTLNGSLTIDKTQRTHPFYHQHHPKHDNLDSDGVALTDNANYPEYKLEVWDIERAFTFVFADSVAPSPDEGLGVLSGTYTEVMTGAYKDPVSISGSFRLEHISGLELVQ